MASAFWTLEDGRVFARRWAVMNYILELIIDELKNINGTEPFHAYLNEFIYREDAGDIYNGFGGFTRGEECIMFNFDLRTFTVTNRAFFWQATQNVLTRLKAQNEESNIALEELFFTLLDMHKRIENGEDPMLLNDLRVVEEDTNERNGPGW